MKEAGWILEHLHCPCYQQINPALTPSEIVFHTFTAYPPLRPLPLRRMGVVGRTLSSFPIPDPTCEHWRWPLWSMQQPVVNKPHLSWPVRSDPHPSGIYSIPCGCVYHSVTVRFTKSCKDDTLQMEWRCFILEQKLHQFVIIRCYNEVSWLATVAFCAKKLSYSIAMCVTSFVISSGACFPYIFPYGCLSLIWCHHSGNISNGQ